ncbi:hypothetical protein Atai01_43940 [Amycolatopsis taiwanensis]|uniref:Polyketide biosynthesis methyltransferase n=2 Tax=Amycolatopsis taiwanensis TaxID=342230 RepID=A0A9W6VGH4_9PSEU|nr:hypothetical protein Atai01_43940 [Amycolatopsis taiwanensis]
MRDEELLSRLGDSVDKVSVGRVYDYLLGGVHNYAHDREFAEEQLKRFPDMRTSARANRDFLGRVVRYAMAEGVNQFVDIGSGLPTQGNVHEVADEVAPGKARVVYIDNEPIAHAHAQILLDRTADPARHFALDADFFDRERLWRRVLATGIDPSRPICLLMVALLHFMPAQTRPEEVLAFYRDVLPPGSLLVISHVAIAPDDPAMAAGEEVAAAYRDQSTNSVVNREIDEIKALFGDFELVDPGLVWLSQWRPTTPPRTDPTRTYSMAGVARKPSV